MMQVNPMIVDKRTEERSVVPTAMELDKMYGEARALHVRVPDVPTGYFVCDDDSPVIYIFMADDKLSFAVTEPNGTVHYPSTFTVLMKNILRSGIAYIFSSDVARRRFSKEMPVTYRYCDLKLGNGCAGDQTSQ